jgi:uncharacterized membrane protein
MMQCERDCQICPNLSGGRDLFLLPIVVVAIIVGKALAIAAKIVGPHAAHLPEDSVFGLDIPKLLAIALLVLFCFLAGVLAGTTLAQKSVSWLETRVLSNLPGYEFIKTMSQNLLAAENQQSYPVVLARIEDCWQVAFLIERLADGQLAVYVPGVLNPQSGSVYFMTEDRIMLVDIPSASVLECLKRYGLGSNALLGKQLALANQSVVAGKPE